SGAAHPASHRDEPKPGEVARGVLRALPVPLSGANAECHMMGQVGLVLSCEHAGNEIPAPYAPGFRATKQTLGSHRGYDPGSHALAQAFATTLGVRLYAQSVSRL